VFPDVGPVARALLSAAWLGGQAVLVATGSMRPDAAFAFRMFAESSTISFTLSRDVGNARVVVDQGTWLARDSRGVLHRFRWDDRVKDTNLWPWGQPIHASYGASAQLDRLSHALDDVASHMSEDAETTRLVADVVVRKNGGPPERVHLERAR
jgi:hypothetical protein